jgi:hypothetical protein
MVLCQHAATPTAASSSGSGAATLRARIAPCKVMHGRTSASRSVSLSHCAGACRGPAGPRPTAAAFVTAGRCASTPSLPVVASRRRRLTQQVCARHGRVHALEPPRAARQALPHTSTGQLRAAPSGTSKRVLRRSASATAVPTLSRRRTRSDARAGRSPVRLAALRKAQPPPLGSGRPRVLHSNEPT